MSTTKPGTATRPTIITVFAILTLVNCGIALIYALLPDANFNGMGDTPAPPRDLAFQIADVVLALAKAGAALLILQMRKLGVYIYIGAEVLVVGGLLYSTLQSIEYYDQMVFSEDVPFDPAIAIVGAAVLFVIASIVWCSVYASNLKKMR